MNTLERRLQALGFDARLQGTNTILIMGKDQRIVASIVRWSDNLVIQYGLIVPSQPIAKPWSVNRIADHVRTAYALEIARG